MKSEWRLFGLLAGFLFFATALYAWWTWAEGPGVEWVGTVALVLSALLFTMCGGYFALIARRIDPRPEDRADAEIADGAGELGFFSPHSYWPFGIALSAAIAALGMAYFQVWLIAVGLLCVLIATSAMLFEYYTGTRRAEH